MSTTHESDDTVHLYVLTDGDLTDTERWMTVAEARSANEHAEKVTDGTWGWYRKHADVMVELEEPTHPHPRIAMMRARREITDRTKHTVDLTGYELRIIRRALAMFQHGPSGSRVSAEEVKDAGELQEFLSALEVPDQVVAA